MTQRTFDYFIIGGGQAGIPLAYSLAKTGATVALAERKQLGGSCVNFGCTPTKAAIASAKLAHQARRAAEYGLRVPTVEVDFSAVLARARAVSAESRTGLEKGFAETTNPKLFPVHARLTGRTTEGFTLTAGDKAVTARQVILNTGTRTAVPDLPGLRDIPFLDSGNWLEDHPLPSHLVIVGGSYIGLEMGQFYRRMGSKVTILHGQPQIIEHEDADIAAALHGFLEREGIEILTGHHLTAVERDGNALKITAGPRIFAGCQLFLATGRKPNTDDLGLEIVGLPPGPHGIVPVDERLATPVPGLWAAGDIRGGPMFTHTSWDDNRILLSQLTGDRSRTTDRIVPYAIFTDPELGRVGLTERDARQQGKQFDVRTFELKKNGKARELSETDGFIKLLIEQGTEQILGAAVLCYEAAELVHLFIDMMNAHAPAGVLRNAVHIHPTLAEAMQSAVK